MTFARRVPVVLVTLLTLGSGLLNVYAVVGRGLPERVELPRAIFPLSLSIFPARSPCSPDLLWWSLRSTSTGASVVPSGWLPLQWHPLWANSGGR